MKIRRFPFRRKEPRQGSLATKVRLAFLVLSVVPFVVFGSILIYLSFRAQQQALAQLQSETAQGVSQAISSFLESTIDELKVFEKSQPLLSLDQETQQATLERLLDFKGDLFDEITLVDSEGNEVSRVSKFRTYLPEDLTSRSDAPGYQMAHQGKSYISPVYLFQNSLPLVTVAVPVFDEAGNAGALMAEVGVRQMWKVVSEVELGKTGYAYIVDEDGTLLAHTTLAVFFSHQQENLSNEHEVQEALVGENEKIASDTYVDFIGNQVASSHAQIKVANIRWIVVVSTPTSEAFSSLNNLILTLGGILIGALFLASVVGTWLPGSITRPLGELEEGVNIIGSGQFEHQIEIKTGDEIERLANAFNRMGAQLHGLIGGLEQRVEERTKDLENRTVQLHTATEVSKATTSILDVNQLLPVTVELIRSRFDLYYVGLFLEDANGEWAILRAGTGEAGRIQMEKGHQLKIGGSSMIGQCIAKNEARIALDVGEEAVHFQNPYLLETRSEMALPLTTHNRTIGALTVQSSTPAAFSEEDVTILQTMADQLANAIYNARLFEQTQKLVQREQMINQITSKIQRATDIEGILSSTVSQLGRVLRVEEASIRVGTEEDLIGAQKPGSSNGSNGKEATL